MQCLTGEERISVLSCPCSLPVLKKKGIPLGFPFFSMKTKERQWVGGFTYEMLPGAHFRSNAIPSAPVTPGLTDPGVLLVQSNTWAFQGTRRDKHTFLDHQCSTSAAKDIEYDFHFLSAVSPQVWKQHPLAALNSECGVNKGIRSLWCESWQLSCKAGFASGPSDDSLGCWGH